MLVCMITEQQKYVSGVLRNVGFALMTPIASIAFQWLVFQKSTLLSYCAYSVIVFLLGWIFVAYGYLFLEEHK